ncbi:unnamed protein product [Brassica oleracea]
MENGTIARCVMRIFAVSFSQPKLKGAGCFSLAMPSLSTASSDITLRQLPESMTKLQIRPLIVQVERKIFVRNHLSSGC